MINLLQTHIDVAAQQIVIEALIIEVNTSDVKELGVEWGLSRGHVSGSFGPPEKNSPAQGTFILALLISTIFPVDSRLCRKAVRRKFCLVHLCLF